MTDQTTVGAEKSANRSSVYFLGGVVIAAGLAVGYDSSAKYYLRNNAGGIAVSQSPTHLPLAPRGLMAADRRAAEVAWAYFETNTRAETGWVDSVAGFASTTVWDQGSYVLALIAARELELISQAEFDARATRVMEGLMTLPLFDGKLPNKAYDTRNLLMVDYNNSESRDGIGWSALDVARMLSALRILERLHPSYGADIRGLLAQWDLQAMIRDGQLFGALREGDETVYRQEGRLGYEQYAARAAALWGLDVLQAISAAQAITWQDVSGVEVPVDLRSASAFGAITPTLSEPYMLQGLELGLDAEARVLADRVYRAQQARFDATGTATMVSEDHIDQAPYFLYSSVFSNSAPWAVMAEDGIAYPDLRTLSTKAVFAWDALYGTEYTALLRHGLEDLADPVQGWRAGRYEADGRPNDVFTLNTNAVILEAIHYIENGPLWQVR